MDKDKIEEIIKALGETFKYLEDALQNMKATISRTLADLKNRERSLRGGSYVPPINMNALNFKGFASAKHGPYARGGIIGSPGHIAVEPIGLNSLAGPEDDEPVWGYIPKSFTVKVNEAVINPEALKAYWL